MLSVAPLCLHPPPFGLHVEFRCWRRQMGLAGSVYHQRWGALEFKVRGGGLRAHWISRGRASRCRRGYSGCSLVFCQWTLTASTAVPNAHMHAGRSGHPPAPPAPPKHASPSPSPPSLPSPPLPSPYAPLPPSCSCSGRWVSCQLSSPPLAPPPPIGAAGDGSASASLSLSPPPPPSYRCSVRWVSSRLPLPHPSPPSLLL